MCELTEHELEFLKIPFIASQVKMLIDQYSERQYKGQFRVVPLDQIYTNKAMNRLSLELKAVAENLNYDGPILWTITEDTKPDNVCIIGPTTNSWIEVNRRLHSDNFFEQKSLGGIYFFIPRVIGVISDHKKSRNFNYASQMKRVLNTAKRKYGLPTGLQYSFGTFSVLSSLLLREPNLSEIFVHHSKEFFITDDALKFDKDTLQVILSADKGGIGASLKHLSEMEVSFFPFARLDV